MKNFKGIMLLGASLLAASSGTIAQEYNNTTNIYAGGVYYLFDNDWNQDDDLGFLLGGEIPIAERWGLAAEYWNLDSDVDGFPGDADVEYLRVAGNYHLQPVNKWQPYLSAGLGRLDIDRSGFLPDADAYSIDIGAGFKYMLSNNFMLRGDAKALFPSGSADIDYAFGLSLAYSFGPAAQSTAAPAREEPAQVVQSEPEPAPLAPPADSDMDGVIDSLDNCPDTPVELAVDESGCPILDVSQMRQTLAVNFDSNQAVIKPEYENEIADFAEFMNTYANTTVVIEGHTDSDGSEEYNQDLSEARALAIVDELVDRYSISASRVSGVGYGESRPIASNDTAAGKAQNRRIEAAVSVTIEEQRLR